MGGRRRGGAPVPRGRADPRLRHARAEGAESRETAAATNLDALVAVDGAGRRRAVARGDPYPEFTRSEAERRLEALCKAADLPPPKMNARVAGYEIDAFWPAQRLVVEIDGWRYHGTRRAFERDRRKDAALQAAAYEVVRMTWRRLTTEPYAVSAQLGALLALDARLSA